MQSWTFFVKAESLQKQSVSELSLQPVILTHVCRQLGSRSGAGAGLGGALEGLDVFSSGEPGLDALGTGFSGPTDEGTIAGGAVPGEPGLVTVIEVITEVTSWHLSGHTVSTTVDWTVMVVSGDPGAVTFSELKMLTDGMGNGGCSGVV